MHVFAKSTRSCSLWTKAAAIAYIELPIHKKARHHRNRHSKKKLMKQEKLLTEVIVSESIKQNVLSSLDVDNNIEVIDGGDIGNPPINPPYGIIWHCLSVSEGKELHVQDELDTSRRLTISHLDGALPFIRMPRQMSSDICRQITVKDILLALDECEKLRRTPVTRSSGKCIFGDYSQRVMYTCASIQVSKNSPDVLDCNVFMGKLDQEHWAVLMSLMQHAKYCFEALADQKVISHMYHAKQVVPFKTINRTVSSNEFGLKYYSGLAFGCNVFLQCHTDHDFTMSMAQIHLKGREQYNVDDNVVYFCFPTLDVAVSLRPGDFFLFNALIPHCVSSRCRQCDEVMSVAVYLKSAVVGMI